MRYSRCFVAVLAVIAVVVIAYGGYRSNRIGGASANLSKSSRPSAGSPGSGSFNKHRYSTTDPASLWLVVNKQRPLNPETYRPATLVVPDVALRGNITGDEQQLRGDTAAALKVMFNAAKQANVQLNVQSGYRSYDFQVRLYHSYVVSQGQQVADTQSARPGYSEHQTGLAVDVGGTTQPSCNVAECFASTPEGQWLAADAYRYGFIIRYPTGKENITGYEYEPWHLRYIGSELASEMHKDNVTTLEEFFGLSAAPNY